jgi:hypothetical protein
MSSQQPELVDGGSISEHLSCMGHHMGAMWLSPRNPYVTRIRGFNVILKELLAFPSLLSAGDDAQVSYLERMAAFNPNVG